MKRSPSPRTTPGSQRSAKYVFPYNCNLPPKDILLKVLDGIDISLVDPLLFPELIRVCRDYIELFKQRDDLQNAKKVQDVLEYMEKQPHREELAAILTQDLEDDAPPPPAMTDEEVQREVDDIIETGQIKIYNKAQLKLVIAGMRQKRSEFIGQGDYMAARNAEHYCKTLINAQQLTTVEQVQENKVEDLTKKLEEARQELDRNKARWEKFHQNMKAMAEDDYSKAMEAHNQKIEQFEQQKQEKPPPSIRKYSNALLQYRRREQAMISSKRYSEAAQIKALADKMQEDEDRQHVELWNQRLNKQIEQENERHDKFVKARRLYWKNEENKLFSEANKEVGQLESAIQHLELNLEEAKSQVNLVRTIKKETTEMPVTDESEESKPVLTPQQHRQKQILNHKIYTKTKKYTQKKASSPQKTAQE